MVLKPLLQVVPLSGRQTQDVINIRCSQVLLVPTGTPKRRSRARGDDNQGPSRRLVKRSIEELSPFLNLWLTAERPMTTLDRASQLTAAGD